MKPRLLDLFCGAGGCARGYQDAGYYVVGVDIEPQPNYCGDEFYQADALEFLNDVASFLSTLDGTSEGGIDVIHASPPCPHYANVTRWTGNQDDHPALIEPTRELLTEIGIPWVIENVRTKALRNPFVLCGSQFGLPVRRHRYFESPVIPFTLLEPCRHRSSDLAFMHKGERAYADAMGCTWMSSVEARQAIPPAYTEFIGRQLLDAIEAAR
jgi:hypothetical protein